ncbi:hypothetical protein DVH05_025649 [Phytophthora capsici]|nr:hypothetical protein DVH05_003726 [Phytophthora capsici]KAG1692219.1 hypothetical protein DVH05_025649 [Phytophthora capsici]
MAPFPPISISSGDANELQALAKTIVAANLNRFEKFSDVDPSAWNLVKSKEQMRLYAERRWNRLPSIIQRDTTTDSELQVMLCVGSTPGTMESVMSKMSNPEINPALSKTIFATDIDRSTVLSTIQSPTLKEPFNSVKIKWMELDVRRRAMGFIKNRDYVYIEASGVENLGNTRVGYYLMHSVDVLQAPSLSGRIRGELSVCFFFRQENTNSVAVNGVWMLNPMNEQARRVIVPHFAQMMLSLFTTSSTDGKMKKLKDTLGKSYTELNTLRGVKLSTPYFTCVTCSKRLWAIGKFTSQHDTCNSCLGHICNSCRIDKKPKFLTSDLKETTKDMTLCLSCLDGMITAEEPKLAKKNQRHGAGLLRRMCHSVRSVKSPGWAIRKSSGSASFSGLA